MTKSNRKELEVESAELSKRVIAKASITHDRIIRKDDKSNNRRCGTQ